MKLLKIMMILACCLLTTMPSLSQTHVKIEPASSSADVGDTFTINVEIESASNLRGVSVKIGFDPAILSAKSISSGGFMQGFGQTFSFSDKDNVEGWAQYDESILGSGDMAQGSGIVCKMTFEAIGTGSSSLTLLTADLRDANNMPITRTTDDGVVLVGGSAVVVRLIAALEGPFDTEKGFMRTQLADRDLVPLNSPYGDAPETVNAIPENVVDWVLVQLRQSPSGATIASKSCFLKSDGLVIQADGQGSLMFWGVDDGSYYIVLSHRNHLDAMSANAIPLNGTTTEFDFSTSASNLYGSQAKLLNANPPVYGLFAGDGNGDGQINQTDVNGVLDSRDSLDYSNFDYNMSGIVSISDVDFANNNGGTSTKVPAN